MIHGSLTLLDYAVLALSCFFLILGICRGASGVFSFLCATVVSVSAGIFVWEPIGALGFARWVQLTVVVILGLLAFGVIRVVVKKLVNSLLAQPADCLFGLLLGVTVSILLFYIVSSIPLAREHSVLGQQLELLIKAGEDVR